MNKFNSILSISLIDEQLFSLNSQLIYENDKYIFIIHKGFKFDGASIPRPLWSLYGCPFGGIYTMASCLHDALYATHLMNRKDADKLFHEAMTASGVNQLLAKQLYLGVRSFGENAYTEKQELAYNREFIEIKIKGYND